MLIASTIMACLAHWLPMKFRENMLHVFSWFYRSDANEALASSCYILLLYGLALPGYLLAFRLVSGFQQLDLSITGKWYINRWTLWIMAIATQVVPIAFLMPLDHPTGRGADLWIWFHSGVPGMTIVGAALISFVVLTGNLLLIITEGFFRDCAPSSD
jgi:hypothetical protein